MEQDRSGAPLRRGEAYDGAGRGSFCHADRDAAFAAEFPGALRLWSAPKGVLEVAAHGPLRSERRRGVRGRYTVTAFRA